MDAQFVVSTQLLWEAKELAVAAGAPVAGPRLADHPANERMHNEELYFL